MIHYIEGSRFAPEMMQCEKIAIALFGVKENELCQKQLSILRDIEKLYTDTIEVFQIDLEETQEIKMRYNISSFPTMTFFKNGKEIERINGIIESEDLIKLLEDFA